MIYNRKKRKKLFLTFLFLFLFVTLFKHSYFFSVFPLFIFHLYFTTLSFVYLYTFINHSTYWCFINYKFVSSLSVCLFVFLSFCLSVCLFSIYLQHELATRLSWIFFLKKSIDVIHPSLIFHSLLCLKKLFACQT